MKQKNNTYFDNPFTKKLLERNAFILEELHHRVGFSYNQNNFHLLTNEEKYILQIFKYQSNLFEVIEQIRFIKTFIRRFPDKNFYNKNGINQLVYIQYHTEVLSHKVHTILEIMKLIINELYELKIPLKDCSWQNLIRKLSKDTLSMQIIDNYFKTFESIIDLRHLNAHRGIYNDSSKNEIELDFGLSIYEANERMGIEIDNEFKKHFPRFLIDHKTKVHRKERLELINKTEEIIHNYIKEFLTSLYEKLAEKIS